MHWYFDVIRKYVDFSGRARRSEYWYFALFNLIILVPLALLSGVTAGGKADNPFAWLYVLYVLAILLPSIGVNVRRLHDIGKSGWWIFIGLIPFIGGLMLLIWHCMDSEPETNRYGPNPKTPILPTA